jgi:general nucleoside transport system permease protein
LAGSYYSTMRTASFQENMTAGHGFLALALVIMGRWSVVGLVMAGLFFGLVRQVTEHLLVTGTQATAELAPLLNMLPYGVSLLALAGLAGRSRAPAGLGKAHAA